MNWGLMNASTAALPIYGAQTYYDSAPAGQNGEVVQDSGEVAYSGPLASAQFAGEPAAVWIGLLALLFIVGWYGRNSETLGGEIPKDIRVGFYNWLVIGISAATFTMLGKIVFTRFPVPGISNFFKAL